MRRQGGSGITAGVTRTVEALLLKEPAEWPYVDRRWSLGLPPPSYVSEGATR